MYTEKNISDAKLMVKQVYSAHFSKIDTQLFQRLTLDNQLNQLESLRYLMEKNTFDYLASETYSRNTVIGNLINAALGQVIELMEYLDRRIEDKSIAPQRVFDFTPKQYCGLSKYSLMFLKAKFNQNLPLSANHTSATAKNPSVEEVVVHTQEGIGHCIPEISDALLLELVENLHSGVLSMISEPQPVSVNMDYAYTARDMDQVLPVFFGSIPSLMILHSIDYRSEFYLDKMQHLMQNGSQEYTIFLPVHMDNYWLGMHFLISDKRITACNFYNSALCEKGSIFLRQFYTGLVNAGLADRDAVMPFQDRRSHPQAASSGPLLIENLHYSMHHRFSVDEPDLLKIREHHLQQLSLYRPDYFRVFLNLQQNLPLMNSTSAWCSFFPSDEIGERNQQQTSFQTMRPGEF